MAGTREEERQHFKKQTDRRDFNPKRKNSLAGKNKDPHSPLVSGTVISPTTPTSAGSTTYNASFSSAPPGPALPSSKPVPEHVPVNNFNSADVSSFLNNGWNEAMERYHNNSDTEKPDMYKSTEKAWGTKVVWGQKAHLMANGNDFFTELRKSIPKVSASNAQPATAK